MCETSDSEPLTEEEAYEEMRQADKEFGPSQSEIIEMQNEYEGQHHEPCGTCQTSHDPNTPCGMGMFGEP